MPVVIRSRYFTLCEPPMEHSKFENKTEVYVSRCTVCDKKEKDRKFSRCSICYTKYCSTECHVKDHTNGKHKEKCAKFQQVKKRLEPLFCKKCWTNKWKSLSHQSIIGTGYDLCSKCQNVEDSLIDILEDVSDDKDIYRAFIS